ncbi:hypothetical protein [Streptomyces sp. PT12]|uniref:hypothetical protein n=1 Tax=Streptomyces sp. PT12 TaxID=1510197 RepID=UPI000DE316ED|nr:hypothetical protein [Streptomyces sp. PT12]RBM11101.1 hypothetical protein DEH69_22165 [Streptomyces sp. PT12]
MKHWDGRAWSDMPPPTPGLRPIHLHAGSDDSLWLIGDAVPWGENGPEYEMWHWDHGDWARVEAPLEELAPTALAGDGRGGLWLTRGPEGFESPPFYWHFDGHGWDRVEGERVTGAPTHAYAIADLAPIGHTGRLWAVGGFTRLDDDGWAHSYDLIQHSTR